MKRIGRLGEPYIKSHREDTKITKKHTWWDFRFPFLIIASQAAQAISSSIVSN